MSAILTEPGELRRIHKPPLASTSPLIAYNSANLPHSPPPFHSNNRNFFSNLPHTTSSPSPSEYNRKLYTDSEAAPPAVVIDTSSLPVSSLDQFMLNYSQDIHNQASALQFNLPLVPGDNVSGPIWGDYAGGNGQRVANASNSLPASATKGTRMHQRGPSSTSSIASNDSATPLMPNQQQQQQQLRNHHGSTSQRTLLSASRSTQKPSSLSHQLNVTSSSSSPRSLKTQHLPTPSQTPVQEAFLTTSGSNFNNQNIDSTIAASLAMNQALLDAPLADEELPGMSTGRHSFSSIGQEPATPMTTAGDHNEESMRSNPNGEKTWDSIDAWLEDYLQIHDESDVATSRSMIPKFERTISDIYGDEGFIPQKSEPIKHSNTSMFLSPYNNAVTERLQAAQMARSSSGASSQSRAISPFRADSPWATGNRYSSAAQAREHQKAQADADELAYQISPHASTETTQTISPKDALLEYHPTGDEQPLFPQTTAGYGNYAAVAASSGAQAQYIPSTSMDFGSVSVSRAEPWLAQFGPGSMPAYSGASPQSYNFASPAMSSVNGLPMFSSQLSNASTMSTPKPSGDSLKMGAPTPDFPAHLTSMESSASEAAPPSSAASNSVMESPKPNTSADTGTYSCTYHGCTQRFSTSQKLQKHKRDAHRSGTAITPGVGSGMSTAALMARNSQAGPHKCERINPKTGQPCNTIFSRPYDLTRHEDTTHNIRKQKIRCALCTEEKTFSRSDALTRHMRIVHPDVDFPGKHRRRGGTSD
jgi:hypothetical protein